MGSSIRNSDQENNEECDGYMSEDDNGDENNGILERVSPFHGEQTRSLFDLQPAARPAPSTQVPTTIASMRSTSVSIGKQYSPTLGAARVYEHWATIAGTSSFTTRSIQGLDPDHNKNTQ